MPIGSGSFTGKTTSAEDRLMSAYQQLDGRYQAGNTHHEKIARSQEGGFDSFVASIGRGVQEGAENVLNLPTDLAGMKKWVDFDYIKPREGFLNESTTAMTQFAVGLPVGGVPLKAAVKTIQKARAAKKGKTLVKGRDTTKDKLKKAAMDGMAIGAGADFVAFSGNESLIYNLLDVHPELQASYGDITSKEGWQNMSLEELTEATLQHPNFSAQRLAENWGGRGANVLEGAFIGALLQVTWRAARLKFNSDKLTNRTIEGSDEKIKKGVEKTVRDGDTLNEQLTVKELQEHDAFQHGTMKKEGHLTPEDAAALKREEAELAKAQADLAESAEKMKEGTHFSVVEEVDEIAPKGWDDALESRTATELGVDPEELMRGAVRHENPTLRIVDDSMMHDAFDAGDAFDLNLPAGFTKDTLVMTSVTKDGAEIVINQPKVAELWSEAGETFNMFGRKYAKDAFNSVNDLAAFIVARERASVRFPQLKGESAKGWKVRLDQVAANELKRKGLGNFWKYEFTKVKGMEQFKLDDDMLHGSIFSDPEQGAQLAKEIANARGTGLNLEEVFSRALDAIQVDKGMSDATQKYTSSRLMNFFMSNMRKGFESDPLGDQMAKAIGWSQDTHRQGAKDFLRDELLNDIDAIAQSSGLTPQGVAERFRLGRGDYKDLFPETSIDDALKQDVAATKELYIRTWAYRLDQAVSMKQMSGLAEEITEMEGKATTEQLARFATQVETIQSKMFGFRHLRQAEGRALAANRSFKLAQDFAGKGGTGEKIMEEIMNKAGGKKGMSTLASRINAIFQANKNNPKGGASSAADLLNKSVSGIDIHNEYWMNSLLSGTRTQVVNTVGTALHMAYKPIEGLVGSAFGKDKATRAFFRNQVYYAANMMTETIKAIGALGLNKATKVMRLVDEGKYLQKRGEILNQGGQGAAIAAGSRKSLRRGKGTLESRSELFDIQPSTVIASKNISFMDDANEWARNAFDFMGAAIRVPSRLMIATDELFKQVQFRSASMSKLYNEALEKIPAKSQDADTINNYITERFQGLIRGTGARFTPDIIKDEAYRNWTQALNRAQKKGEPLPEEMKDKEAYILNYITKNYEGHHDKETLSNFAMDWAEDSTFTRGLDVDLNELKAAKKIGSDQSSFTKSVQDMASQHSWMRIIIPFVRTPVNLLKFPLQRLPVLNNAAVNSKSKFLKKLHHRYQADMASDDPIRKAAAQGRMRMGAIMYPAIALFAASGQITGNGPTNPRQRRALMATGWRAYSIKVGDRYVSYARLDPFSTVLGLAADSVEFVREAGKAGDIDDSWAKTLALAGTYSLSNNIANKSFLAGLSNILSTLTDPVGNGNFETLVQKQLTSYVPKALSQFTVLTDDHYIKKSYGLLDAMKSQVPGMAGDIDPMRNFLGDPMEYVAPEIGARAFSVMNPFLSSKYKKDDVLDALAELGYGFGAPEPKLMGKSFLDMRKYKDDSGRSAYDFYQEQIGKTELGGKTLRTRLADFFKTTRYKKQTAFAGQVGFESLEVDPRITEVKSIVRKYRDKAKKETKSKYPELVSAERSYKMHYKQILKQLR